MNEPRLFLLQLRRILIASSSSASSIYKKAAHRRLSFLNVFLQKQKLFELSQLNYLRQSPSVDRIRNKLLANTNNKPYKRRLSSQINVLLQKHKLSQEAEQPKFYKPTTVDVDQKEAKTEAGSGTNTVVENIYTIPNGLCVARIASAPVITYMILHNQFGPAIGLFAVAGVTDLLDGWIARTIPGQSSVMGSFLDPMADKILVGSLFLSLTAVELIPVPLTVLILGRDAILLAFGFYIRYQSLDPPKTLSRYFNVAYPTVQLAPTLISKVNTGVQLGLVGATLLSAVLPALSPFLEYLWYFTASTTIASAVSYLFAKDTVKLLRKHGMKK